MIGLVSLALLTFVVIAGCGDDDTVTNNPPPPQYTLTFHISPDSAGTVTADPDKDSWLATDTTTLTAVADSFYVFDHWEYFGDTVAGNPVELTFEDDRDEVITAVFASSPYTLTVDVEPVGAGTVTLNPDSDYYAEGDTTVLTAVPADGWVFDHWVYLSDDYFGNPVILTFEGDSYSEEMTAVFIDSDSVVTLSGSIFLSDADLAHPILLLMDETLEDVLLAWELPGGSDTATFTVHFNPESVPASHIYAVDNLDDDLTVFEDGEPYQCYDSDDAGIDCDFVTYTKGQEILGIELELFVIQASVRPKQLPFQSLPVKK
jgi:hypothetical protein